MRSPHYHDRRPMSLVRYSLYITDEYVLWKTYAIDFTKKLYGKKTYKDFTPTQVLTGFMFWGKEWMREPILRLKGSELRDKLNLEEYVSPMSLFGQQGYILGPYLQEARSQENDNVARQLLDTDDKMMLLMELMQGKQRCVYSLICLSRVLSIGSHHMTNTLRA